jgi:hypothetical protein
VIASTTVFAFLLFSIASLMRDMVSAKEASEGPTARDAGRAAGREAGGGIGERLGCDCEGAVGGPA